ncbi:MAG: hypothetical protein Q4G46_05415 [Propionibacteriaceae bacterium]|nr:hypothetical protein [Propionibacteriaceae bacterium]
MSQPPQGPGWGNPPGQNPFNPAAGGPPQGGMPQGQPGQGWQPQGQPGQGGWQPQQPGPAQGGWQPQGQSGQGWQPQQTGPETTQPFGQNQPFGGGPQGPGPIAPAVAKAGLTAKAKGLIAGGVALAVVGAGTGVVVADPLGLRDAAGGDWVKQVPASAAMIAGVNLEPGATQQLEMVRFALKFPSVRENLSLTEGSDLREAAFESLVKDKQCGMTFADDIDPWFGNQIGVFRPAGTTGESVMVLEAKKEDAARAAVTKLAACDAMPAESVAYNDGFLLVGTEAGLSEAAVAEAATSNMADRAEYKEDMAQLDATGLAMFWAQADSLDDLSTPTTTGTGLNSTAAQARSFAGSLRFSGGNPEMVVVAKSLETLPEGAPTNVGELPGDTAAAFAIGGGKNYAARINEALATEGMNLSSGTGLRMPQDLETLLGDEFVIAADRFDPNAISDPTQIPVGLRIKTDTAALRSLEDRINTTGLPIAHLDEGGTSYLSLSPTYAAKLKAPTSKLADEAGFKAAVAEPGKAQSAMYVNIATFADILKSQLEPGSEFTAADVDALQAVGVSGWTEGENYQRGVMRLTAK